MGTQMLFAERRQVCVDTCDLGPRRKPIGDKPRTAPSRSTTEFVLAKHPTSADECDHDWPAPVGQGLSRGALDDSSRDLDPDMAYRYAYRMTAGFGRCR